MYIWEKFWDSWASVVFSDGRVYGAIRLGMLLDSKKGDRASAISCTSVSSEAVLTAFTTDLPCLGGRGRVSLGRETRVSHLVSV